MPAGQHGVGGCVQTPPYCNCHVKNATRSQLLWGTPLLLLALHADSMRDPHEPVWGAGGWGALGVLMS